MTAAQQHSVTHHVVVQVHVVRMDERGKHQPVQQQLAVLEQRVDDCAGLHTVLAQVGQVFWQVRRKNGGSSDSGRQDSGGARIPGILTKLQNMRRGRDVHQDVER
jgi:hypothetical protein